MINCYMKNNKITSRDVLFHILNSKNEKLLRLSRMQTRISSYNVFTWAKDIFKETFDNL